MATYLQNNFNATVVNVYELPAEDLLAANFASADIKAANELVAQAEVVVLLTPIYKGELLRHFKNVFRFNSTKRI